MPNLDVEMVKTETAAVPPPKVVAKTGGGKKVTVKKAAKKASAKPAKKAKSAQAQTGEAIELPIAKMNKDELVIVKHCYTPKGDRKEYSIKDLKAVVRGPLGSTLRVRNALRRTVRGGWLEKVGRGLYRITEKARKRGIGAQS